MGSQEFRRMVEEDIKKCEAAIQTKKDVDSVLSELTGKYSKVSDNFPEIHRNIMLERRYPEISINGIISIKGFLEAFLLNDCQDYRLHNDAENRSKESINVNINNTNKNENNNTNIISSFQEAKSRIEQMSALQDDEIEEILAKITELESIISSEERKSKKWEKAKSILAWIANRSFDVAMTMLPLFMKLSN